jgi:5-formyltetrahydrofolate cyclo-ligase
VSVPAPPSHRLKRWKRSIRRATLERRDALGEAERRAMSERIARRVLSLPEVKAAGVVMAFWSFGSEVETASLIERLDELGKRVVLPRVEGRDVVAVAYRPGDPVSAAAYGANEPTASELVDPVAIDVVIVPGVAFDRAGGRIGYGGGFYDRFLAGLRPGVPSIAIAFGVQVVDEVPRGGMDRPVDVIVTEEDVIRCDA